jgi:hypothetical protein
MQLSFLFFSWGCYWACPILLLESSYYVLVLVLLILMASLGLEFRILCFVENVKRMCSYQTLLWSGWNFLIINLVDYRDSETLSLLRSQSSPFCVSRNTKSWWDRTKLRIIFDGLIFCRGCHIITKHIYNAVPEVSEYRVGIAHIFGKLLTKIIFLLCGHFRFNCFFRNISGYI